MKGVFYVSAYLLLSVGIASFLAKQSLTTGPEFVIFEVSAGPINFLQLLFFKVVEPFIKAIHIIVYGIFSVTVYALFQYGLKMKVVKKTLLFMFGISIWFGAGIGSVYLMAHIA